MQVGVYGGNDLRKKIEDYSYGLKDVIGRGFSSVVYRGSNDKTREKVAIKVIDIRVIQGKPEKRMLEGEIDALKKLNHPNILKCHDIFSTANNCYIITEFCNEGDLENLLKKREKLSEEEAIPLIREFLMGYMCIADNGFLHRDLKPANILLKDKTIKIADFGFAKRASSNPKETVNVGSPLYMSPEALQGNIYTAKNDIWSVGVILYEMLHGKAPWTCSSERQLIEEINKNNIYLLKGLSEDLKDFIRRCLVCDQSKRMSAKEMANHPLVARIITDAIPSLKKIVSANQNQDQQILPTEVGIGNKPKSLHHRPNPSRSATPQEQFICQINWMRFLNKFSLMFPEVSDSGRYTLGLHFIVLKQMFAQLTAIERSMLGENPFMIDGWKEYVCVAENKAKYTKTLEEYRKKYEPQLMRFQEWIPIVGKDKKLTSIADANLQRSQFLSMVGVSFAIEESKGIWQLLEREKPQGGNEAELQGRLLGQALRLDFTMTYYQLNCLLLDNFTELQCFTHNSRLDLINDCRPAALCVGNLPDLHAKMKALQLLK